MNKKGFVLAETLVVILFVVIIFTLLYTSAVPLLGRYNVLSYYDDLDTTYDVYRYKKLFESDSNYKSILENDYKILTCNDFNQKDECLKIDNIIDKRDRDILLYFNSDNINLIKEDNNISDSIKDYLRYIKLEGGKLILLLSNHNYISYIELVKKDLNSADIEKIFKDKNNDNCSTYIEEDGIIYISGSKECIDFNYVWWSGKMWRITAIYPDGAMKMITDNNITTIAFNDSINYYTKADPENNITESKSYMFQWLNEDFLDTLYNHGADVIDTTKYWNATMPVDKNISIKPGEDNATMIPTTISPIGLLNNYEYYKSYQNTAYSKGYLNIGYYWWLLNPYDSTMVYCIYNDQHGAISPWGNNGVRPSIYLKPDLLLFGSGTKTNPYRLSYDYSEASTNDLLNTRKRGESVKLADNGELFRIVGIENNKTKIVSMNYADNNTRKKFATSNDDILWGSGTTTDNDTWYTYLNNTYLVNRNSMYGDIFDSGTYYLGTSGKNYKLSVCASETSDTTFNCIKTSQVGTFNIGLLRYGEMFAAQQGSGYSNSKLITLINSYSTSNIWGISGRGDSSFNISTGMTYARPTVHLKSTVKIHSGSGTEFDPYIVG